MDKTLSFPQPLGSLQQLQESTHSSSKSIPTKVEEPTSYPTTLSVCDNVSLFPQFYSSSSSSTTDNTTEQLETFEGPIPRGQSTSHPAPPTPKPCPSFPEKLSVTYSRSSGPGGQNVNKCMWLILLSLSTGIGVYVLYSEHKGRGEISCGLC